ncbi:MAG: UDP-N-acetylenolpyruvoylglucosamine reductase [Flavobacteriales bacterium]|nr:UDP-N-acetylenolpyruvoylglucosamine reductase [Flavobacteriales bacterium]
MNIINSQSLLDYNTFKVDVSADLFKIIDNEEQLQKLLEDKRVSKQKKMILGGGSNILFTKNFNGLVIHNKIRGIQIVSENKENVKIKVGAGEVWDDLVAWTTKHNYYGIENLSLIPGSVGAAPIQNIGAYGSELKDTFQQLEAIDLKTKDKIIFNKSDCRFGYRDSIFKKELKNRFIITNVYLKLTKIKSINLSYKILKDNIATTNLKSEDVRKIIINIRNSKLPNPKKIGNAGSFFKNPILEKPQFKTLQKKYPEIPFFEESKIKVPAGWLIEKLNWKGHQEKTCGVYAKHALIIINNNNATGLEIKNLAEKIKESVYQKFNILLEEEVTII